MRPVAATTTLASFHLVRLAANPGKGEHVQAKAVAQLAAIERRRLRRAWKANPLIDGATIVLLPHLERKLTAYLLRHHGFDLDAIVSQTGWLLTPRARDRCRWAAYFGWSGKSDHRRVARRLKDAVGDDVKFYSGSSWLRPRPRRMAGSAAPMEAIMPQIDGAVVIERMYEIPACEREPIAQLRAGTGTGRRSGWPRVAAEEGSPGAGGAAAGQRTVCLHFRRSRPAAAC